MTSSHVQFNPLIVLASEDFLLGDLDVAGSLFTCYTIIPTSCFFIFKMHFIYVKGRDTEKETDGGSLREI